MIDRQELIRQLRSVKLDGGNPLQWVHLICDAADMLEADEKIIKKEAVKPVCPNPRWNDKQYICPICGNEVAGYTDKDSEYWGYHQDKFCSQCGAKIKWEDE